ncbi:hypothetical protein D3C80_1873460 [compost metagenome]
MQVTFYEVEQGDERWFEMAIAVDRSRSFRMPVFFTEKGVLTTVSTDTARQRIDAWLKHQAVTVAALSKVGLQPGQETPYLTISETPIGR